MKRIVAVLLAASALASASVEEAIREVQAQHHEEAFRLYLAELEGGKGGVTPSAEELKLYEEALPLYLESAGATPLQVAETIQKTYGPVVEAHPDYLLLNILVASSYANVGDYATFFERFHSSAQAYPDHYLTHKIRGILRIKLMERAREPEEKAKQRALAVESLQLAVKQYPADTHLYRIILMMAEEERKKELVQDFLTLILEHDIKVGRQDLVPLVHEAVRVEEHALGERFIERAEEWYGYSRALNHAKELLKKG